MLRNSMTISLITSLKDDLWTIQKFSYQCSAKHINYSKSYFPKAVIDLNKMEESVGNQDGFDILRSMAVLQWDW